MDLLQSQEFRQQRKPNPSDIFVSEVLRDHWKLDVDPQSICIERLDSYDDANYKVRTIQKSGDTETFLLKIYNNCDSEKPDFLIGLSLMLMKITEYDSSLKVPLPVRLKDVSPDSDLAFRDNCDLMDGTSGRVAIRLFKWVHGNVLTGRMATPTLEAQIGTAIGKIFLSLQSFSAPCFQRVHLWDLAQFDLSYHSLLSFVGDEALRGVVSAVHRHFRARVLPLSKEFPTAVIMADCNDANIILHPDDQTVGGLIDFSDAVLTWAVNDVAIAMAYCTLTPHGTLQPLVAMGALLSGYLATRGSLLPCELQSLLPLVCVRLSISILVGAFSVAREPSNLYLGLHAQPARDMLRRLWGLWAADEAGVLRFFEAVSERAQRGTGRTIEELAEGLL